MFVSYPSSFDQDGRVASSSRRGPLFLLKRLFRTASKQGGVDEARSPFGKSAALENDQPRGPGRDVLHIFMISSASRTLTATFS